MLRDEVAKTRHNASKRRDSSEGDSFQKAIRSIERQLSV